MGINLTRLSKKMALALRHRPDLYRLELDPDGWVAVEDLLAGLRGRHNEWRELTLDDILAVLNRPGEKPRYELREGKIRALHGHSLEEKIQYTPAEPPEFLYHGTSQDALDLIQHEGLKPMSRQYVHLSVDVQMAHRVGGRKSSEVVILKIRALEAHQQGILFYQSSEVVWLADEIPPEYIIWLNE